MEEINSFDNPSNLPQTMTREEFSKKMAETINMPREKVFKMT
jgi:hypothetical protein